MVGTFSALSPAVIATIRTGSCGTDAYSWWTAFPYLLGDVIWLCACYLQLVESLNMDYEMRVELWEASKQDTPKPRYKWVGFMFNAWDWWGAFCYLWCGHVHDGSSHVLCLSLSKHPHLQQRLRELPLLPASLSAVIHPLQHVVQVHLLWVSRNSP